MLEKMLRRACAAVLVAASLGLAGVPAHADMVLSQVILDFTPDRSSTGDIEVWNSGSERLYVAAEVAEIIAPGLPEEQRRAEPDPGLSGLLVTPQLMVLEPGQRRVVRISAIAAPSARDRVYRVTIKPVAGPVQAKVSSLKILVGYDVLVLVRPKTITGSLVASRTGRKLVFRNNGNTSQEVFNGRQCDEAGGGCLTYSGKRLYPGASYALDLAYDTTVRWDISNGVGVSTRTY